MHTFINTIVNVYMYCLLTKIIVKSSHGQVNDYTGK